MPTSAVTGGNGADDWEGVGGQELLQTLSLSNDFQQTAKGDDCNFFLTALLGKPQPFAGTPDCFGADWIFLPLEKVIEHRRLGLSIQFLERRTFLRDVRNAFVPVL